MTTFLYRVSGAHTVQVYYGYAATTDVKSSFLAGTQRTDAEDTNRGDYRLLVDNKHDIDSIVCEIVDEFGDEFDAWCTRNDLRATDLRSITGPTMFPTTAFTRAKREAPQRVEKWGRVRQYETALEAYQNGAFSYQEITALVKKLGKALVLDKLAALSPAQFAAFALTA
jgi:hypothetical protein